MNTKKQAKIAASIHDQMLDVRLGFITTDEWVKRFDEAEAAGVELSLAARTRRAALRGVENAKNAGL